MSTPLEFYINEDKGHFERWKSSWNDSELGEDEYHVIEKTPEVVRKLECFDELLILAESYQELSHHLKDFKEKEKARALIKRARGL